VSATRVLLAPVLSVLMVGLGSAACSPRESTKDEAAPAPVDTTDNAALDTTGAADTSVATPPINPAPAELSRDTPPSKETPAGAKIGQLEYEGWRQYSVHCARCHGQDALPNPVAANLLVSLGPGGPIDSPQKFAEVVTAGRPASGMPAFKGVLTPEQINAIYAYLKGRAEKRIPPGRPQSS
jgi:mono/diheme cytochrome c family protein